MASLKIKRGTRAQIVAAQAANALNAGEPYLITDEGRFALGTASNSYGDYALRAEAIHLLESESVYPSAYISAMVSANRALSLPSHAAITAGGTYPGSGAFAGGVLLPDGRVFCVPRDSTTARITCAHYQFKPERLATLPWFNKL